MIVCRQISKLQKNSIHNYTETYVSEPINNSTDQFGAKFSFQELFVARREGRFTQIAAGLGHGKGQTVLHHKLQQLSVEQNIHEYQWHASKLSLSY